MSKSMKGKELMSGLGSKFLSQMTTKDLDATIADKPVTNIQYFYCRDENEIVVSGKRGGKNNEDYLAVITLKYDKKL